MYVKCIHVFSVVSKATSFVTTDYCRCNYNFFRTMKQGVFTTCNQRFYLTLFSSSSRPIAGLLLSSSSNKVCQEKWLVDGRLMGE
jgi:hypothetical protein